MAVSSPNIKIKATLERRDGSTFELWPREASIRDDYFGLEDIFLNEDMFAETISGSFSFVDSSNIIDQLNISTEEWLRLELDGKLYNFRITEVTTRSNLAQKITHGPSGAPTKITLNFVSDEFVYRNFNVKIDDFVGKISKATKGGSNLSPILTPYDSTITIPQQLKDKEKGFVQFIMQKASVFSKKPLAAHETFNDISVLHEVAYYPYLKDGSNLRISNLMNYICEYACYINNPNAVNFFFWEDLDKWNFKCIEGLIEEQLKDTEKPIPTYRPQLDEFSEDGLFSMEILNDSDTNQLLDSEALFSTYDRIKPNWANPYRGFVDINQSITVKTINYNYTIDFKKWYDINGSKGDKKTSILQKEINLISDTRGIASISIDSKTGAVSVVAETENTPHGLTGNALLSFDNYFANKHTENIFGFYSAPYNNTKSVTNWQLKTFTHTTEKEYWQSQFDFCEAPGSILMLVRDIKNKSLQYQKTYADLKNKKAMWDVYRKKMCCERTIPSNFFAVITGAEKIYGSTGAGSYTSEDPGGIWSYSWVEVEIWPQEKKYNSDTESYTNKITQMLKGGNQIIEFETAESDASEFPFIFVQSPWALRGEISKQKTLNLIAGTTAGVNVIKEVTINTKDNRAYNLNEILNSRIPNNFESGTDKTIIMNPGISNILADINTNPDLTNYTKYPQKTQMLPVGKFRVISNKCPNFLNDGQLPETTSDNGFYYAGRIVQMSAVPKESIQSIILPATNDMPFNNFPQPQPEKLTIESSDVETGEVTSQTVNNPNYIEPIKRDYLFLFDTENAHDGFCDTCDA
jgi:hypothetical protein